MLSEGAESFTVTLGAITSTLSSQVSLRNGAKSAQATIAGSDPITISIAGPSTVDEGDTTTAYTVSLSPSGVTPTADLTVSYATADGTATAGSDYTAKSGTLTFTRTAAGSQTLTVQTTEDILAENSETFTVSISGPSGGGATPSLGTDSVTTSIRDNDALILSPSGPIDIELTVSPETVNEGAGSTGFTVTATHDGSTQEEAVTIQLSLGGTATPGSTGDYTAPATASVTIPANSASGTGTLTLNILQDTEIEGDETIIVGGSSGELVIKSATITIHDDEATYLSISGPAEAVDEGDTANFTVTLSKAVTQAVTVAWNAVFDPESAEAADLSATSRSGERNLRGQQRRRGHAEHQHHRH